MKAWFALAALALFAVTTGYDYDAYDVTDYPGAAGGSPGTSSGQRRQAEKPKTASTASQSAAGRSQTAASYRRTQDPNGLSDDTPWACSVPGACSPAPSCTPGTSKGCAGRPPKPYPQTPEYVSPTPVPDDDYIVEHTYQEDPSYVRPGNPTPSNKSKQHKSKKQGQQFDSDYSFGSGGGGGQRQNAHQGGSSHSGGKQGSGGGQGNSKRSSKRTKPAVQVSVGELSWTDWAIILIVIYAAWRYCGYAAYSRCRGYNTVADYGYNTGYNQFDYTTVTHPMDSYGYNTMYGYGYVNRPDAVGPGVDKYTQQQYALYHDPRVVQQPRQGVIYRDVYEPNQGLSFG